MTDTTYIRDPSSEEAIKILRSGLSTVMREVAAAYVMPICWIYSQDGKPFIPDNGSAFMLNTGQEAFTTRALRVSGGRP